MARKVIVAVVIGCVLLAGGTFFWARSVFGRDAVRVALARQLANALGQPVTIGSVKASIYPRVTVTLNDVGIGDPVRIQVRALDIGTDLRALISRRIEHATLHLNGARLELPLPSLVGQPGAEDTGNPVVTLVSIDEIVLADVDVVSGGRTLHGDVRLAPHGDRITVEQIDLSAEDTSFTASGEITSLAASTATLSLKAGLLNVDKLLAFANDFAAGTGLQQNTAASPASPAAMDITLALEAERATLGALSVERLSGRARMTPDRVILDPLAFGLFDGRYEGTLSVDLASALPAFRWRAALSGIDIASAVAFMGSPDTVTGRLSSQLTLAGRGADLATAMKTARGTATINATDGIVKNLGLIRAIIAATSLDPNAVNEAVSGARDEPFTRLGATLAIGDGEARTTDLRFESDAVTVTAAGASQLDGSRVDFKGDVQLSEALTKQTAGGGGLLRVAQQEGRLTLPATVTGSASAPRVRIDVQSLAGRALKKTATEQGEKLLRGLGGLLRR